MSKVEKIKVLLFILFIVLLNCNWGKKYELLPPKEFIEELESEIKKSYYFGDTIPIENYLEAIQKLEPELKNVNIHNAKDYIIEYLRKNSDKSIEEKEIIYKKTVLNLLANFKGRNIFISPSTIQAQTDKENTAGIGLVLFEETVGKILIIDIIEGSPGYVSEIKPNQYIQSIDNESIDNLLLEDVIAKIKGKPKTPVKLVIQGIPYELYRSNFNLNPIRKSIWNYNKKKILYLQIRFIVRGIEDIIKQNLFDFSNIDYLVLDLRYLSTGEIEEVFKIADLFLPKNKVLNIKLKNEKPIELTTNDDIYFTGKIFVLYQEKSTPFAYALTKLLESSKNVKIIGPKKELPIYIGKLIPIKENSNNYGAFYLTNGIVEFYQTNVKNVKHDNRIFLQSYIPNYPPGSEPNKDDPYHKKIIEFIE